MRNKIHALKDTHAQHLVNQTLVTVAHCTAHMVHQILVNLATPVLILEPDVLNLRLTTANFLKTMVLRMNCAVLDHVENQHQNSSMELALQYIVLFNSNVIVYFTCDFCREPTGETVA